MYVFALHNCREPDQYDPIDLDAWEFYVVSVETLREAGSPKSVSLAFLDRAGVGAVDFEGLPAAIEATR